MNDQGQVYFDIIAVPDEDRKRLEEAEKAENARIMRKIQAEMDSEDGRRRLLDRFEGLG